MLNPCSRSVGEVPERSNGAVSKTVVLLTGDRGFESLPLRQNPVRDSPSPFAQATETKPFLLAFVQLHSLLTAVIRCTMMGEMMGKWARRTHGKEGGGAHGVASQDAQDARTHS